MKQALSSYKNTSVHWGKTQADIMKMFAARGIGDVQFTTISQHTAAQGGLMMDDDTMAVLITFQKQETLPNGVSGMIPVRILVPNVPANNDQQLNQHYRLIYWYLKSKFEAIDTGLVEFAEEFMAHLQLTDQQKGTVGRLWDSFKRGYYNAISSGQQPPASLLPPMEQDSTEEAKS